MTPISAPMLATGSLKTSQGTDRERLGEAAKAFEAIFVRQLLRAARQAGFGDPLTGGQATETFRTMQHDHFADLISKSGALGLAKQIEQQLAAHLPAGEPSRGQ